jgi:tripartite-type tricarboxylate transporter receptor subunit TctC
LLARNPTLPDVPTIAEFVPGYEAIVWNGVVAPKDTSTRIIDHLNSAFTASLADPNVKAQFANVGSVPKAMTPAEFGKFVAEDTAKWGKVSGSQHQVRITVC